MSEYLPFIVIGVTTGSLYGLSAMGLVLTYKTSGIMNFAHGAIGAAAAYGYYAFHHQHQLSRPLAVVFVVVLFGVLGGLVLERIAASLAQVTVANRIVGTIGLLVAIQSVAVLAFGGQALTIAPVISQTEALTVGGVMITYENLADLAVGLIAAAALYWAFDRTRAGIEMRAVVDDPALLDLTGRSPAAVRRMSWMIGSSFAAASGVLLASVQAQIDINVLSLLVVAAFGAAAIGRFSSLPWTFAGGILVGLAQKLASKEVASLPSLQGIDTNMPFLVLFVVLLAVPKSRLVEVGRHIKARALPPPALGRRAHVGGVSVVLLMAALVPFLVGAKLSVWSVAMSQVVLFGSLALLVRTSGQISLAHMAFAAIGAAGTGHAIAASVPWGLAVLLGAALCVPVAAAVAVPAIRLSGVFVGLATLGFGIFVAQYAYGKDWFFGPQLAVPRPNVLGLADDDRYYFLLLVLAVAALWLIWLIERSRLGRLLRALADEPLALTTLGTNADVTRVLIFCIAGFLAGISGATYAAFFGSVSASSFHYLQSLLLLAVLAIAGRRTLVAAVVGPILMTVAPAYLPDGEAAVWLQLGFGVAALGAAALSRVSVDEFLGDRAEAASDRLVGPASARIEALAAAETPT